jgi:hypothetical protein
MRSMRFEVLKGRNEMKMNASLKSLFGGLLLAAVLTGCGGSGGQGSGLILPAATPPAGDASAGSSTPGTGASASSLAQQIEALERKSAYPALDRSSDIAGPDVNQNGVRDDIEAWINSLNITDLQRRALMQKARALQQTLLVDPTDKVAVQRVGEALMASTNCGGDRFTPYSEFSHLRGKIEAMTANTRERAESYMQYNKASSGSVTALPNHDTCEP